MSEKQTDEPFPDLTLREIAELHCNPLAVERGFEYVGLGNQELDGFVCLANSGSDGLREFVISEEEKRDYAENSKIYPVLSTAARVTHIRMRVDENLIETIGSAKIRRLGRGIHGHNKLPLPKTLYYKEIPVEKLIEINDALKRKPTCAVWQKITETIYKPLKALSDDFDSDNPRVWVAVEFLRRKSIRGATDEVIEKMIEASELVQEAITHHVNTKHAAAALESFEAGRQEQDKAGRQDQDKKKRKVVTDKQEEEE